MLLGHQDENTPERITAALDRMSHAGRLATIRAVTADEQAKLWEMFAESPADRDHFVPSGTDPLTEVIHHGRNSLPAFNFFQKRFCAADDDSEELWGFNHQTMSWITGPGFYVAHDTEEEKDAPGAYVINYTRIPPKKPDDWPEILPNEAKLGRFVYSGMKDYMRKISDHVSIGRAYKSGKPMDAWFVLCREDVED